MDMVLKKKKINPVGEKLYEKWTMSLDYHSNKKLLHI